MAETGNTIGANQEQKHLDLSRQRGQAKYAYDQASERGDENGKLHALLDMIRIEIEAGTFENNIEFVNTMQKVAPTLMKNLAEIRQSLAKDGATKTLELIKALRDSQRELLVKESGDIFDMVKGGFKPSINLLGTFKSFALVLEAFGIDTTAFVQSCDDLILAERDKMPKINDGRLGDAKVSISTIAAEKGVSESTAAAYKEVGDKVDDVAKILIGVGQTGFGTVVDKATGGRPAPTPAASPVSQFIETKKILDAIVQQGVVDAAKIQAMVDNVKDIEGNPNTLSRNELEKLEQKLGMNLHDPAKARQVIIKAQEMALQPT